MYHTLVHNLCYVGICWAKTIHVQALSRSKQIKASKCHIQHVACRTERTPNRARSKSYDFGASTFKWQAPALANRWPSTDIILPLLIMNYNLVDGLLTMKFGQVKRTCWFYWPGAYLVYLVYLVLDLCKVCSAWNMLSENRTLDMVFSCPWFVRADRAA